MHVMEPREKWTDERLDEGFGELKAEMIERFDEVDSRFDKLDARFDKLIFALFGTGGAIIVALLGLLGAALF
jgi:hypothetical protein